MIISGFDLIVVGLWLIVIAQDVVDREVSTVILIALALWGLLGHPWYWWGLVAVTLTWPWRKGALALPMVAMSVGLMTGYNGLSPALALAVGVLAWSLGWWGAADAVVLIVLGLRYGPVGLLTAAITTALGGVGWMLLRRRSLLHLFQAGLGMKLKGLPVFLNDDADAEIPAEAEIPAAAVMAAIGIALEVTPVLELMIV
jgi:hypothetical protein